MRENKEMKKQKDKILLFIPMYNCEKQIARVLGQVNNEVLKYINGVITVNNISTDSTESVVVNYANENKHLPITVIRNNDNYGLGGSHKVAFSYAKEHGYDYVIVLHGDDQGDISDLLKILKSKYYRKFDACLGARFHRQSKLVNYSFIRTFGNRVYNLLFSIGTGKWVLDLGSGLNMYKVSSLKNEYYKKYPDNLTFNYCMVMAIKHYKQNVVFFPISWREDDQISNVKLFSQAFKVLSMLFSFMLNNKKFMKGDHREVARDEYSYTIVMENTNEEN